MPTLEPGSKVLVTGANGYIAVWLIRTLLRHGYAVRGTVRAEIKGAFLLDMFKSYGDKLELVVVEDIAQERAFDDAVVGVDAIIHAASPTHTKFDDPKELLEPAINGTVGILKSAKDIRTIKRIIYLSSTATILRFDNKPLVFNENDWNDQVIEELERVGERNLNPAMVYILSKVQAEKAAWSYYREHEKEISWDLTVIHPPLVFGPYLNPLPSPSALGWMTKEWYDRVIAPRNTKVGDAMLDMSNSWADVRDVAIALTKALSVPEAGGERIIISNGGFTWQEWLDVANSLSPSPIPSHKPGTPSALPVGKPGTNTGPPYMIEYDTAKEKRILGLNLRTKEDLVRDTLADFERRGW